LITRNILSLLKPKGDITFLRDNQPLRKGLEKLRFYGYTAIPVIDEEGMYVGTVSEGDFLWHLLDTGHCDVKSQKCGLVRDVLRPGWNPPVTIDTTMEDLLLRVMEQNFVPVIDDRGVFVGIITRRDVMICFHKMLYSTEDSVQCSADKS